MLQRLFSGDKLVNAFMIVILGALLWIPSFMTLKTSAFYYPVRPMPFYGILAHGFEGHVFLSKIFAFLFLIFQSIMIVRLNARFILIQQRTFLPAFFFMLITAFYMPLLNFSEAIFGSFFFIFMLDLLFSTYKQEPNTYRFFEAGLLLGIASLFYARLIYFLPFIWIVAVIIRPFFWREWLYPVLGVILPYLFIIIISYVAGSAPFSILITLKQNLTTYYGSFQVNLNNFMVTGFVFLLIFIASIYMLRVYQFKKIYIRNYYMIFFWLFVSSLLFFVLTRFDTGIVYVFAVPVSFILSNFFVNGRKTLGNRILFGVVLVLFILNALDGIFGWL